MLALLLSTVKAHNRPDMTVTGSSETSEAQSEM